MTIDATFWVSISFFIFCGGLIYLKVPHKINNLLGEQINQIKDDLDKAEKLKAEAKNLLSDYDNKISKSKKETLEIVSLAKENSDKIILEKTKNFHQMMDDRKKNIEQKIILMREKALKDIKNASVKISIEAAKHLIKNSIDEKKIENLYKKSLEQAKAELKSTKI